jgi:biopolymer transport protein ExbD
VGLFGTVIGIMLVFVVAAMAGAVDINSVAPGMAAALLCTAAGLGVAIPALFGYNWLASRSDAITADMAVFVDEFVTRLAEEQGEGRSLPSASGARPEERTAMANPAKFAPRRRTGGINITPFVDVLLVVLVIFILTSNASIPGIKVDLPKASASVALEKPKTKAITIDNAGNVFLDAYPVTLPELEERLRTEKALSPDFPVIVRGDSSVQYAKVVDVLDLLRRIELNQIGLVTGKQK